MQKRENAVGWERGAGRLVAEYGNRLYAAAVLLCANNHDAEELVFRTFDQAVKKIRQFDPSRSFFTWLYAIMLNFHRMTIAAYHFRKAAALRWCQWGRRRTCQSNLPLLSRKRRMLAMKLRTQSEHFRRRSGKSLPDGFSKRLRLSVRHSRRMFRLKLTAIIALTVITTLLAIGLTGRATAQSGKQTVIAAGNGDAEEACAVGWALLSMFREWFHRGKVRQKEGG